MVRRWPLTARGDQLEQLGAWYSEAQLGGALLSGPAGVGKTRLAEEVLALATAAARPTARAVGHPTTRPIPLGALAHLLPAQQVYESGLEFTDRAGLFHAASSALREAASAHRLTVLGPLPEECTMAWHRACGLFADVIAGLIFNPFRGDETETQDS
jgi:hypothetical protein